MSVNCNFPELRLFLDDGRDKHYYNLYIPYLDAPHHLSQVCINCGLARTCHYSTTKKSNDKLGRGINNSGCAKFIWNPGYHECPGITQPTLEDWLD